MDIELHKVAVQLLHTKAEAQRATGILSPVPFPLLPTVQQHQQRPDASATERNLAPSPHLEPDGEPRDEL